MKRRHDMPFGAACLDDGSIRFRLWAPAAQKVELLVEGSKGSWQSALSPLDQGWFELVTGRAVPGDRYSFRIDDGQQVPDPASRFQPGDVHAPSEIIDPNALTGGMKPGEAGRGKTR